MASPIPRDVKRACLAALPSLLRAHGLDATAPIEQDESGWVNPCYFVGDDVVVRFNSREPDLPKFTRETVCFDLLRPRGVPVPDVLVHDGSRRFAPFDALIMRRLPGTTIERSWPRLEPATREALARQVGDVYATLHEVEPGGFGELADPPSARPATLVEALHRELEMRLDDSLGLGVLGADDARACRAVLRDAEPVLRRVRRGVIVHGDLHLGNVLHVRDRVTGVLDFEWSRAGDPVDDLVELDVIEELWPDAIAPLRAAYASRHGDAPDFERRADVHRIIHDVVMTAACHRHFPDEFDAVLARLRARVARLVG